MLNSQTKENQTGTYSSLNSHQNFKVPALFGTLFPQTRILIKRVSLHKSAWNTM